MSVVAELLGSSPDADLPMRMPAIFDTSLSEAGAPDEDGGGLPAWWRASHRLRCSGASPAI